MTTIGQTRETETLQSPPPDGDSRLYEIAAEAGLVILRTDPSGEVTVWSEAATDLLGYEPGETVGHPIYEFLPESRHGEFRKLLDKAGRGRRVRAFETTLENRDGEELHVRVANSPIQAEGQRRPVGVYLILQDITAQVRAEASLRTSTLQSRALFQTVPDAIILLDESGTIESMNPAAEKMFRYIGHEAIGRNVEIFVPEEQRALYSGSVEEFLRDEVSRLVGRMFETQACRRGGKQFPVEVAIAAIEAEGTRTFAGVVRDISERKKQEQMLKDLNASLEDEVRARTEINESLKQAMEELRATQEHLVQSEKMASLGGMVAGVAHEINTPLGVGITASSVLSTHTKQFLQKIEQGEVPASLYQQYASIAAESVKILESNLNRAAELVKSFKQIAVDQTSQQKRPFHVQELIDETLMSLGPRIKKTRVQVEVDCDELIKVIGHAGAFTQILTNFIVNSLVHAYDEGAEGTIRIHCEMDGEMLVLVYSDDGKGMSEEHCSKIFEPFFTTRRNTGGTGLGMHIVYNLIHREEGGTIKVKSQPGEGTEFTVRLPVEPIG